MTDNKPLVSIIVRTKDRPKLLRRAIRSIAGQTYNSIEVVLLNDGGCDLPVEQLREIAGHIPITYIRLERNHGRAVAANIGIGNAKGEYLAFLDDDDELHPDHTMVLASFLGVSDYRVAYTDALFVYKDYDTHCYEIRESKRELVFSEYYDYDRLIFENYIPFNCLMFDKTIFETCGKLDNTFDLYEDWEFLIRIGERFPFKHIKKVTATYNQWSPDLQISKRNQDQQVLTQAYMDVMSKYLDKVSARRIHKYVSDFRNSRLQLKQLQNDLENSKAILKEVKSELQHAKELLTANNSELERRVVRISELEAENEDKALKIAAAQKKVSIVQAALSSKEEYVRQMHSSRAWRFISLSARLKEKLFPVGTKRRTFAGKAVRLISDPKNAMRGINRARFRETWRNFLSNLSRFIRRGSGKDGLEKTNGASSNRGLLRRSTLASRDQDYFEYCFTSNTKNSDTYVPLSYPNVAETPIKLIAFYLPQFHPIPENDQWWGSGFTEWTNVTRAIPQFIGHYQPRLPGELGFYDLRVIDVQRRQAQLARQYGIYGFCFHFYWFDGRTLLEMPLEQFAEKCDFPFCINWANENWTRRWDGDELDILIAQKHSPQDDLQFIRHVSRYLRNSNYIRIDGKPLLLVYRPALLPDANATALRWRDWCRDNGIGEIYLATTHAFEHVDPRSIGFDAALEFPPDTFPLSEISGDVAFSNGDYQGKIFDYDELVGISSSFAKPEYLKFRGICPGWDNEARKPGRGTVLSNATPDAYKNWLGRLCEYVMGNYDEEERLIFVNAWNEWAEGAYMEPDRKYGFANLKNTAEVLEYFGNFSCVAPGRWRMLVVSHDAARGGAQSVVLGVLSWIKKHTFVDIKILCLDAGEWIDRFEALGDTRVLSELRGSELSENELVYAIREWCEGRPNLIYGNSVAAGREYKLLHRLNAPIITHVHEMEMSIQRYANQWIEDVLKYSTHYIACSKPVAENLANRHNVERSRISTIPSSITVGALDTSIIRSNKRKIKKDRGFNPDRVLVFGCGIGMPFRKGADLFIQIARYLKNRGLDEFQLCWIGEFDRQETIARNRSWADCLAVLKAEHLEEFVCFLGLKDRPIDYLVAGDIFVLPSREDPFPLVALEAATCGLPIICFADAGGIPEFVEHDAGFVVPYENVEDMGERVMVLGKDVDLRRKLGLRAREKVFSEFTSEQKVPRIFSLCRKVAGQKPAVSVIVPNYEHEAYLEKRLDSIFQQGFRDFEVVMLDDHSEDGSVGVMSKYTRLYPDARILVNQKNSGSPFRQWLKGIDLVEGDIIWIAESDDYCELNFLENMLPSLEDPSIKLVYANSYVVDENSNVVGDYVSSEYLTSISKGRWKRDYEIPADQEINESLAIKNTILNISAVLFRRFDLSDDNRSALEDMRIAGDWYFIVNAIHSGKVRYDARKLNFHRRHGESVVGKLLSQKKVEDFFREFHTVQNFIFDNYRVSDGFSEKWEEYLRKQWNDFFPNRPFEELEEYYPFGSMKEKVLTASRSVDTCA